ncbi:MAG: TlpA family protein disulfide reductase [Thermodesulfovibrionales bacterium]|nr:TlpA family protein disulfide reductase [Thermodesulfovibrionales bacterium]
MRKKGVFLVILAYLLCITASLQAAGHTPAKGESFPPVTLQKPEGTAELDYLGLKGTGSFEVSEIKADLLIIEIYSMYCPYCQKEAPIVNRLYELISKEKNLKEKVKLIGVGAGNTPFEVEIFRKQYNIGFPLFSDESFAIHKKIGEVRTPFFFVLKMKPDGSNTLVYSKVGSIQDAGQFLEMILKECGLR